MRRGCVQPISPARPRPAARHSFGSCVVLPEPVSPAMTRTWCLPISPMIVSASRAMGRSESNVGFGACDAGFAEIFLANQLDPFPLHSRKPSADWFVDPRNVR